MKTLVTVCWFYLQISGQFIMQQANFEIWEVDTFFI